MSFSTSQSIEKDEAHDLLYQHSSRRDLDETTFWSTLERVLQKLLGNTLYLNDCDQWTVTFICQWLITSLQICQFISDAYIPYEWDSRVASVFVQITRFVTEFWFAPLTNYFVATTIIGIFLLTSVFAYVAHQRLGWVAPFAFLHVLLSWIPSVLFLPLIIPHMKILVPCLSFSATSATAAPFFDTLVCWQADFLLYWAFSLAILVVFVPFCFLIRHIYYSTEIPGKLQWKDNAINSCVANDLSAKLLLAKTIILLLCVAGNTRPWRIPMAALLLVAGCWYTTMQVRLLPWWDDLAQSLYLFQAMLTAWVGLVALLMSLWEDATGTGLLFFLGLPLLAVAAVVAIRWRCIRVFHMSETDLTTPAHIELKARCIIRAHYSYLRTLGHVYLDYLPHAEHTNKRAEAIQRAADVLQLGLRRFPECGQLYCFAALFHITLAYNRMRAYRAIDTATHCYLTFASRFHVRLLRHVLRSTSAHELSPEVVAYAEFTDLQQQVKDRTAAALKHLIHFWGELTVPAPNLDRLSTVGRSARFELATAITHYERLLDLNPFSVPVLRSYAQLCLEVVGDHARATAMLRRAEELEAGRRRAIVDVNYGEFLRVMGVHVNIFDETNGIVGISVDPDTLGIVEKVNSIFARLLGYRESEIIGKNISMIIPEPMRSVHDDCILQYLRTRKSAVVNNTRMVMAQHKSGHLIAFIMHVRWSDESLGKLIAVLQPMENRFEVCAIADPQSHRILYTTRNFPLVFGYHRRDIASERIYLHHMVPPLSGFDANESDRAQAQLFSINGLRYTAHHANSREPFDILAFAQHLRVRDVGFIFLRCQFSPTDDGGHKPTFAVLEPDFLYSTPSQGSPSHYTPTYSRAPSSRVTSPRFARFPSFVRTASPAFPRISSPNSAHNGPSSRLASPVAATTPSRASGRRPVSVLQPSAVHRHFSQEQAQQRSSYSANAASVPSGSIAALTLQAPGSLPARGGLLSAASTILEEADLEPSDEIPALLTPSHFLTSSSAYYTTHSPIPVAASPEGRLPAHRSLPADARPGDPAYGFTPSPQGFSRPAMQPPFATASPALSTAGARSPAPNVACDLRATSASPVCAIASVVMVDSDDTDSDADSNGDSAAEAEARRLTNGSKPTQGGAEVLARRASLTSLCIPAADAAQARWSAAVTPAPMLLPVSPSPYSDETLTARIHRTASEVNASLMAVQLPAPFAPQTFLCPTPITLNNLPSLSRTPSPYPDMPTSSSSHTAASIAERFAAGRSASSSSSNGHRALPGPGTATGLYLHKTFSALSIDAAFKPDSAHGSTNDFGRGMDTVKTKVHSHNRFRESRYHRLLRRAIEVDNSVTQTKLRLMRVWALVIVAVTMAAGAIFLVLALQRLNDSLAMVGTVHQSSLRETYMLDTILSNKIYQFLARSPQGSTATPLFYKPSSMPSTDMALVMQAYAARMEISLYAFDVLTADIDRVPAGAAVQHLRTQPSTDVLYLDRGSIRVVPTPMREAVSYFSAFLRHSRYQNYASDEQDPGFVFALANAIGNLRTAMRTNTSLLMEQVVATNDMLAVQIYLLFGLCILLIAAVALICVQPLVVRVENGKNIVFDIFLAIPLPLRRALRRKASTMYSKLKPESLWGMDARRASDSDSTASEDVQEDVVVRQWERRRATTTSAAGKGHSVTIHADALTRTRSDTASRMRSPTPLSGASAGLSLHAAQHSAGVTTGTQSELSPVPEQPEQPEPADAGVRADDLHESTRTPEHATPRFTSLLGRRSVQMFLVRYGTYFLSIGTFLFALAYLTHTHTHEISNNMRIMDVAAQRAPMISASLFMATHHLFYDQAQRKLTNPIDPTVQNGPYDEQGLLNLAEARDISHALYFGSTERHVHARPFSPEIDALMHRDLCELSRGRAEELVAGFTSMYGYIFDNCDSFMGGLGGKGTASMIDLVLDHLDAMLAAPKRALSFLMEGGLPHSGVTIAYARSLVQRFKEANEVFNDWAYNLLLLLVTMHHEDVVASYDSLRTDYIICIAVFFAFNVCAYVLIFRASATSLSVAAEHSRALILLVPADILALVEPARDYITNNLAQQ